MVERITNAPDNYKYWLPVMGPLMKKLDQSVGEIGLVQTFRKIMENTGKDKFIVKGKTEEIKEILTTKPVVVFGNHSFYLEIFAGLAALEPREDIHILGISNFLVFMNLVIWFASQTDMIISHKATRMDILNPLFSK